jgi:hypothetical protein
VVLITESWLSSSIPDSPMSIGNEYIMFRRDRSTLGGGVVDGHCLNHPEIRARSVQSQLLLCTIFLAKVLTVELT